MSDRSFIARFRELHDKVRAGNLPAALQPKYERARRELARLMLVAQQMNHGGHTLREAFRIAQLVKVELDLGGPAPEKTSTMDLATGGFAALLSGRQPIGKRVTYTLHLPASAAGAEQLKGAATVASSRSQGGLWRVSFSFDNPAPAEKEQLEMAIIDFILRRFPAPT